MVQQDLQSTLLENENRAVIEENTDSNNNEETIKLVETPIQTEPVEKTEIQVTDSLKSEKENPMISSMQMNKNPAKNVYPNDTFLNEKQPGIDTKSLKSMQEADQIETSSLFANQLQVQGSPI